MIRRFLVAVVVGLSLTVAACSSSTSPSNENIQGTWNGFDSVLSTQITMTLSQNGSSLGGTWTISGASHGGTISGTKNGSSVTITLVGNATTCSLNYTGTLSSLTAMSGTVVGQDCINNGGAAITFNKQ